VTDAYLGEIRIFGGSYAPPSWRLCDGELLQITTHTALFSILGTYYGGDGRTTFALPDLMGRAAVGAGQAPGRPFRSLGKPYGTETVQLSREQMPQHNHPMVASATPGNTRNPTQPSGQPVNLARSGDGFAYKNPVVNVLPMNAAAIGPSGAGQPHENMQPYLALSFIICVEGIFPKKP
jgi:microcystin-dependent protein